MIVGLEKYIKEYNIEMVKCRGEEYLVFYKAVTLDFGSWWETYKGIYRKDPPYGPGTLVMCKECDKRREEPCGKGLHITNRNNAIIFGRTTLDTGFGYDSFHLIKVLVKSEDIVCVPYEAFCAWYSFGAIRCKKLFVAEVVKPDM
jgi:hypothetical protein